MEKFQSSVLFNYKPSSRTYELAMLVSEKLGKLNVRLSSVFSDHYQASRIFAFIESKYSSKIEGIYTTLFDVVNTGKISNQEKLIEPLVHELFRSRKNITKEEVIAIANIMNTSIDTSKRWNNDFGVYKKNIKIYQPPMDKNEVNTLLETVIKKAERDVNIIQIIHTHILFEKIHPFADANGRIGRLIFQKSLARIVNFSNVLPVSWALFKNLNSYYNTFDIGKNKDIDKGIQNFLNILLNMYEATKKFTIELKKFIDKNIEHILISSYKMTQEISMSILLSLQTRSSFLQRKYGLNPRTIDSAFNAINMRLPFNRKNISNKVNYWNIELEEIIDHTFN